jgi:SAM-dependent MidA family methyltransferase
MIRDIQATGPIPFARFMDVALYHPEHGYYMREPAQNGARPLGEDRIGWDGDFYTSTDVHPALAQALAAQLRQFDAMLGHPDPLTVVEMGPGKGLLARDLLRACAEERELMSRLRYVLVERSPAMRAAQSHHLAPWAEHPGLISWNDGLDRLPPESVVGLLLSNELVDAFPAHRVTVRNGRMLEIFVDYADGRFCERLSPPSTPELADYLARLDLVLPEGAVAEINLAAVEWMKAVARTIRRGFVLTIDYGHTAQDLYGPERRQGTLLCYSHHLASDDPYRCVGLQDMTAHVDFTSLASAGEEAGLHVTGFTNQMSFLMSLGIERQLEDLRLGSPEFQSLLQLLRPDGMGRTFKILIQHKGIPAPALDGLRFKPFFGTALRAAAGRDK